MAIKIYKLSAIGTLQTHQARREVRLHSRSMEIYPRSVLALFAAFEENGQLVLVQEYAPGGDLYRAVWNQGGRQVANTGFGTSFAILAGWGSKAGKF